MMRVGWIGCGLVGAMLALASGCGGSNPKGGTGGAGGTLDAGGSGGVADDALAPTDAGLEASGEAAGGDGAPTDTASACPVPGVAVTDPFAGVWTGVQGNETYIFTNSGGCTSWTGSIGAMVCDVCTGSYAQTGSTTASATLYCHPTGSCSVSPVHTDTGILTLSGCAITYDYNYGGGSSTVSAMRSSEAPTDVCAAIDAGTD